MCSQPCGGRRCIKRRKQVGFVGMGWVGEEVKKQNTIAKASRVYGCLWMFMVGVYIYYLALDMVYKPIYNWEGTTLCGRIGLTLQLSLQC